MNAGRAGPVCRAVLFPPAATLRKHRPVLPSKSRCCLPSPPLNPPGRPAFLPTLNRGKCPPPPPPPPPGLVSHQVCRGLELLSTGGSTWRSAAEDGADLWKAGQVRREFLSNVRWPTMTSATLMLPFFVFLLLLLMFFFFVSLLRSSAAVFYRVLPSLSGQAAWTHAEAGMRCHRDTSLLFDYTYNEIWTIIVRLVGRHLSSFLPVSLRSIFDAFRQAQRFYCGFVCLLVCHLFTPEFLVLVDQQVRCSSSGQYSWTSLKLSQVPRHS